MVGGCRTLEAGGRGAELADAGGPKGEVEVGRQMLEGGGRSVATRRR